MIGPDDAAYEVFYQCESDDADGGVRRGSRDFATLDEAVAFASTVVADDAMHGAQVTTGDGEEIGAWNGGTGVLAHVPPWLPRRRT